MRHTKAQALILATLTATAIAPASANEFRWGVGLGSIVEDSGYKGVSSETNLLPILYIETERFRLAGPSAEFDLYSGSDFGFSLIGQYRADGYEKGDGDIFAGMQDRDDSFDLGFEVEYETDFGDFELGLLSDVSGTHKGHEASLTYSVPFTLSRGAVSPYLAYEVQSSKLVDYYYGVRESEATALRPFYKPGSVSNVEVGIDSEWLLGERHRIVANVSYVRRGSEVEDSPLIDSASETSLTLGYVYEF